MPRLITILQVYYNNNITNIKTIMRLEVLVYFILFVWRYDDLQSNTLLEVYKNINIYINLQG